MKSKHRKMAWSSIAEPDDLQSRLQDLPLRLLEDDCSLLGSLLDEVLKIELGDAQFAKASLVKVPLAAVHLQGMTFPT